METQKNQSNEKEMEQILDDEQDEQDESESEPNNQYGFTPMLDPEEKKENENKRKREEESGPMKEMKLKINRLLCRYPGLKPRTSHIFMNQIQDMDLEELNNVYENMINDLSAVRGFPTSESAIIGATFYIDHAVPGYMNTCLKDEDLKRDLDVEIMNAVGQMHNYIVILLRFFNNFVKTIYGDRLHRNNFISVPVEHQMNKDELETYVRTIHVPQPQSKSKTETPVLDGEPNIIKM